MVVNYDLLLQVVDHFIANFVCLVDTVRDRAVSCLKLVNCRHLVGQILLREDEPVLCGVLHQ